MNLSFRAKNNNAANSSSPPSKTPISIAKHLSDLRLTHAPLLAEHCATAALLRHREAEVVDLERRENNARQIVETLEADVHALGERLGSEIRGPAERAARFLQSLMVRHHQSELSILIDPHHIEH